MLPVSRKKLPAPASPYAIVLPHAAKRSAARSVSDISSQPQNRATMRQAKVMFCSRSGTERIRLPVAAK
jgi:hypothetical protein